VARVWDGQKAVGCAVRVGSRYLITLPSVVNRALNRGEVGSDRPYSGAQVEVVFGAKSPADSARPRMAKVVEWGPLRPGRPNIVVLRSIGRLPWQIPVLKLARRPNRGLVRRSAQVRARMILPGTDVGAGTHREAGAGPGAAAIAPGTTGGDHEEVDVDLRDRVLVARRDVGLDSAGAPILPVAPTGGMLALVAPDTPDASGGDTRDGDRCSERLVPVVEADEVRAVLRPVQRRTLLRYAATGAGLAAIGGGVVVSGTIINPGPVAAAPKQLHGLGWDVLFRDEKIQRYLREVGKLDATDVKRLSGVMMLNLTKENLVDLDFVTCPNLAIANHVKRSAGELLGRPIPTPTPICTESMVILARAHTRTALTEAGLLVRVDVGGDPQVRFDFGAYLRRYGQSWKGADPKFQGRFGSTPIKIAYSDPTQAGGGLVYLAILDWVQQALGRDRSARQLPKERSQYQSLWNGKGPLSGEGADATAKLNAQLESGYEEMILTYEHEAISFLLRPGIAAQDYVLLRTSPEAKVDQSFVSLSDNGADLADRVARDSQLAEKLYECHHIRVTPAMSKKVDDELMADPLRQAVWRPSGREGLDTGGLLPVVFDASRMRLLLIDLKKAGVPL
jgi:hypothetical protein